MKRLILLILLCFSFVVSADARMSLMQLAGEDAVSTPGCSSYQPTDADICCQDADGSTAITNSDAVSRGGTWVATEDGTNSISAAAVSAGIACTDEGTYAFEVDLDAGQGEEAYIEETGFSMTNHSGKFMIKVTANSYDADTHIDIVTIRTAATGQLFIINISEDAGGNLEFDILYRNNADGYTSGFGAGNYSYDTWYMVSWQCDVATPTLKVWIGAVLEHSVADHDVDNTADVVRIGSDGSTTAFDGAETVTYQIENFKVDGSTTVPDTCEGG